MVQIMLSWQGCNNFVKHIFCGPLVSYMREFYQKTLIIIGSDFVLFFSSLILHFSTSSSQVPKLCPR